jgi:hypothetical protein
MLAITNIYSQGYQIYKSESLSLYSENWRDSIAFDIMVPNTALYIEKDVKYPLLIIFDSQHSNAYPLLKEQLNFLMADDQIPEMFAVGIPFGDEERNPLTSENKMEGRDRSGQELTEAMLFDELIPKLKVTYPISDYLLIAGHSRTAFLTSYLMMSRADQINIAMAFSGFYSETLENSIHEYLADRMSHRESPFYYYISAGTSPIESNYRNHYGRMQAHLDTAEYPESFRWLYRLHPAANHMTNYVISLPDALLTIFEPFNLILYDWLLEKLEAVEPDAALELFKNDLEKTSDQLGLDVIPTPTHINSIASYYWQQDEYAIAQVFLELGLSYYPKNFDFYSFKAFLYKEEGKNDRAEDAIQSARVLFEKLRPGLNERTIKRFERELVEYD